MIATGRKVPEAEVCRTEKHSPVAGEVDQRHVVSPVHSVHHNDEPALTDIAPPLHFIDLLDATIQSSSHSSASAFPITDVLEEPCFAALAVEFPGQEGIARRWVNEAYSMATELRRPDQIAIEIGDRDAGLIVE